MKIGLFIPCYIDQFYPKVGIATLELLTKLGCEVDFPQVQTCCGQPLANSGMESQAIPIYHHFVETFAEYDYIVAPSGSCVHHVRHHYNVVEQNTEVQEVRQKTLELSEFLVNVLKVKELQARFPFRVGLHQSCHGLRGLRLGQSSERVGEDFSNYHYLLNMVEGLELIELDRVDECCGFGGTFAVSEAAISTRMGLDRLEDHQRNQAEVITAGDMSCLMHLEGLARRQKMPLQIKHIAEILNAYE